MKKYSFLLFYLLGLLIAGCDQNAVYKGVDDIENGKWYVNKTPEFSFRIEDTIATYSLYYTIRNSLSYPYYNLYIRRYLLDSVGTTLGSRLDELNLLDSKTGKPYGNGLGDLFDHRIRITQGYRFPYRGNYTLKLRQYMRQDPLPEIYGVGISVEKEK